MLSLLLASISCMLNDFDESFESHFSDNKNTMLAFFYNNDLKNFDEYKKMLNRVLQYTTDFEILMVNCSKYTSFCIDQSLDGTPGVKLYTKDKKGILMSLEVSVYNIIAFVTTRTSIRHRLPPNTIKEINENNFANFFYTGNYHIIEFFEESDQASEMLGISFEEISNIYSKDIDIKFGRVNCTENTDFCIDVGTSYVPIIRLYKNGNAILFEGTREIPYILNFINENCNKHRSINGEIKFDFDDSTEEIVENFMKKPHKSEFINQAKTLENGQSFLIIMNRILKEGNSAIINMLNNLQTLLKDPNVKGESFDNVSEKISILKLFQKFYPYVEETEL